MTTRIRYGFPALSEWEAAELPRARARGMAVRELAERHGVSRRTIYRYLARPRYRCIHCEATYHTAQAALEHVYGTWP